MIFQNNKHNNKQLRNRKKTGRVEVIWMNKNRFENIVIFMKNEIECEHISHSGPKDLAVSEAAIQTQSSTYKKYGCIKIKDSIESLE